MRNIQKSLAMVVFALLLMISCRRETLPDKPNSPNEEDKTSARGIYRKTPAEIAAAKEKWLASARASLREEIAARGGCGDKHKNHLEFVGISGTCSGTWDVEYYIWSLDWVGSGYATTPVSVSFTNLFSNSISSTLLASNATLDDPGCTNWWVDGYCLLLREYVYELSNVTAPSTPWPSNIGNYTLNLLSGFLPTCTPLAVTGNLKGSLTGPEIAGLPALMSVDRVTTTSAFVKTECSLLCYPPNVICPNNGVFTYWPQGFPGSAIAINPLSGAGQLIFGLSSGVTYEYSCTLNYTIGGSPYTSLTKTGTF